MVLWPARTPLAARTIQRPSQKSKWRFASFAQGRPLGWAAAAAGPKDMPMAARIRRGWKARFMGAPGGPITLRAEDHQLYGSGPIGLRRVRRVFDSGTPDPGSAISRDEK
jgi:hypothetical protein